MRREIYTAPPPTTVRTVEGSVFTVVQSNGDWACYTIHDFNSPNDGAIPIGDLIDRLARQYHRDCLDRRTIRRRHRAGGCTLKGVIGQAARGFRGADQHDLRKCALGVAPLA